MTVMSKQLKHPSTRQDSPDLSPYCRLLEARGEEPHKYLWQMQRMFADIRLDGTNVLDIGAGWGRHTFYFAAMNATSVLALEPEFAGSSHHMVERMQATASEYGYHNIDIRTSLFEETPLPDGHFDVVFSHAVINHIHETRDVIIDGTPAAIKYEAVFEKMHRILKPGGVVILIDANRRNVGMWLQRLGIKNPFTANVDWFVHQTPTRWQQLMQRCGFRSFQTNYYVPYAGRHAAWLWDNPVADYFTYGVFTTRAYR